MKTKKRIIKIRDQKIYISQNSFFTLEQTNINDRALRFRNVQDIYWEIEIDSYDKESHEVDVKVTDYHPANISDFYKQSLEGNLKKINFQNLIWEKIEPCLSSYQKSALSDILQFKKKKKRTISRETNVNVNLIESEFKKTFIANKKDCIILKEKLDIEQGACFSINPFTAYGLVEMAEKAKCKAIVQNAAGGQVSEFVRILAAIKGIDVINIVRKQEQVISMKEKGVKYILDSTVETFSTDFSDLVNTLKPTMAFDAVGGEMTGLFIKSLPSSSSIILYGGLAGGSLSGIDPLEIIFKGKKLEGFNLNDWIANKTHEEFDKVNQKIQDLIIDGKVKTEIQATFKLDDVVTGIRTYIKSMSSGKVLFKP